VQARAGPSWLRATSFRFASKRTVRQAGRAAATSAAASWVWSRSPLAASGQCCNTDARSAHRAHSQHSNRKHTGQWVEIQRENPGRKTAERTWGQKLKGLQDVSLRAWPRLGPAQLLPSRATRAPRHCPPGALAAAPSGPCGVACGARENTSAGNASGIDRALRGAAAGWAGSVGRGRRAQDCR